MPISTIKKTDKKNKFSKKKVRVAKTKNFTEREVQIIV